MARHCKHDYVDAATADGGGGVVDDGDTMTDGVVDDKRYDG